MFQGLYVALVTPFTHDGSVNRDALRRLVQFHIEQGTDGLVVCGTTGESACLSAEEQAEVLDLAMSEAAGRIKIVAGAGARSTRRTEKNVKAAREAGADGALVVTPYYNKPGQEGLYRHFRAVAECCDIPIMLYNVPSRTGVDLLPETVVRLAELPNIKAIKEATADIDRLTNLVRLCSDKIDVLSGHDPNLLPALSVGCNGIVSVAGNLIPHDLKELFRLFEAKEMSAAVNLHQRLFGLCRALAVETNPVPIKEALNLLGWEVGSVRPPLAPISDTNRARLKKSLLDYGFQEAGAIP
jgi:4-hydroxy-tetrahydrodipicolinate synthase